MGQITIVVLRGEKATPIQQAPLQVANLPLR